MSRLTKYFADRDEYGHNSCHGGCESCTGVLCGDAFEMIKKLAHYEDLEEQGRLIEQKHGRWTGADGYSCSKCSESYMEVADADAYASGWKPNYCPNCGAKMDEVE